MPLGVELRVKIGRENSRQTLMSHPCLPLRLDFHHFLSFLRHIASSGFLKIRKLSYPSILYLLFSLTQEALPGLLTWGTAHSSGLSSRLLLQENLPDPPDGSAHYTVPYSQSNQKESFMVVFQTVLS